jgi:hypothetical protein
MRIYKPIILTGIMVAAVMLVAVPKSFAGAGIEPPENAVILDVEIWGVVTMICQAGCVPPQAGQPGTTYAMARVKRIDDCDVEVETEVVHNFGSCCPSPATYRDEIEDWSLVGIQFFDIDPTAIPYIDDVKNFDQLTDGNGDTVTTFDAKFKFYK